MTMDTDILQIVLVVTILGFLWKIHCDLQDLREEFGREFADLRQRMVGLESRLVRVEGLLKGLVDRSPEPQS